jgi:hypothetical protein
MRVLQFCNSLLYMVGNLRTALSVYPRRMRAAYSGRADSAEAPGRQATMADRSLSQSFDQTTKRFLNPFCSSSTRRSATTSMSPSTISLSRYFSQMSRI